MANKANIQAVITADDRASSVLRGFGDHVGSVGSKIAGIAEVAAKATLAAGAAATAFGVMAVKAYQESAEKQAQLAAVIKSTNGVAGQSIDVLNKQAQSLQNVTRFTDEQVNAAQAMLLTFRDVRGEVFTRTIPVLLDMATAMHEDLQSAAIQVGKALNDPITGITALRRVGVTFNDTQKQQIQNFVDTNQLAKAQGLILDELQKEFGGSAKAAGQTFGGQLDILKNKLNDVEEQVGYTITKALVPFATRALEAVSAIDWTAVINRTIDSIKRLWGEAVRIAEQIYNVGKQVYDFLLPSLTALFNTLKDDVLPVLVRLWHEVIEPLAPVIGTILVGAIWLAINALNVFLAVVTPVINFLLDHKWIVEALAAAFVVLAARMAFNAVTGAFNAAMDTVIAKIGTTKGAIGGLQGTLSTFTGFAIIAGAATIAANQIVQAANRAKAAWDNAAAAAVNAGDSDLAVINQLKNTIANGTPEQRARARTVLNRYQTTGHFAQGVTDFTGGLAYVHKGELLVNMPRGTDVIPKSEVDNMTTPSNSNINININAGAYMGSQIEARKFALQILQALQDHATSKNTTVANMIGTA